MKLNIINDMNEWSDEQKKAIWERGQKVNGYNSNEVRKDACGAFILYSDYGIDTAYGWQVDHIFPISKLERLGYNKEEIDNIDNLRPMHWRNKISKSDDYPSYTSVITGSSENGDHNIDKEESKIVNQIKQGRLLELYPKIKEL